MQDSNGPTKRALWLWTKNWNWKGVT